MSRRVVVTGGARGLGASHVRLFAERGATVILADMRDELGESLAEECRRDGLDVRFAHLDVTSERSWSALAARVDTELGALDVLVNNAGVAGEYGGLPAETHESWDRVIQVNQTGTFLGMQAMLPALRRSSCPAIVNVASMMASVGDRNYFAYCASKGAVVAMTRSAALALADDGIRVNSVSPGMVRTDMNGRDAHLYERETPLGRMAHPREISEIVVFLASETATFITGSDYIADGGFTAR